MKDKISGGFHRMVHFLVSFRAGRLNDINIFEVILLSAIVGSLLGAIIYMGFLELIKGS